MTGYIVRNNLEITLNGKKQYIPLQYSNKKDFSVKINGKMYHFDKGSGKVKL